MYTVIKSKKGYGYSIKASERKSWILNGFIFGWYKLKRQALEKAEALNNAKI